MNIDFYFPTASVLNAVAWSNPASERSELFYSKKQVSFNMV